VAELMGICGADPEAVRRVLDLMQSGVDCSLGLRAERWEADALGLLRFHHGAINPQPQPVRNEDSTLLAAMDGELFDTAGLRARLTRAGHALQPAGSDAELVLHLYEEQGERAFRDLCGSFSACLYDRRARCLTLATDRFFSRPIFYCLFGGALVFSSRFNTLVTCGALAGGRLNMTAVMQLFTFQHVQHTDTHYREALAMPAASVLHFEGGRIAAVHRYWQPVYGGHRLGSRDWEAELADALREAARKMTADPLRKGVLLSGGMDSRTLVAAAPPVLTAYTVGDSINREVHFARRVARAKGIPHVFLRREPDHYARLLDESVALSGGMRRFDHAHFLGHLERLRQDCDVAFVEEQMDILFKGWYWTRRWRVRGLEVPCPAVARFAADDIEGQILRMECKSLCGCRPWLLFREPWRSRYEGMMRASVRAQLDDAGPSDPYNMVEHVGGLVSPGRTDAFANITCLRPALEYRSMCFDPQLLELALAMPVQLRMNGRALHGALRRLSPRLYAIPYANTGLRLDAPAWLGWSWRACREAERLALRRLGIGRRWQTAESWPNRSELLRTPPLRDVLESTLADDRALPTELFDRAQVDRLQREHLSGRWNHMRTLLLLLTFGRWFRTHGPASV
jgi:asparagine synthase (glutamine-hydrolysing)